jgi:hypothetical protein
MTQDEMLKMAKQAGWQYAHNDSGYEPLWAFAKLVAAKEREACMEACEKTITSQRSAWGANFCIEAIRARGQA